MQDATRNQQPSSDAAALIQHLCSRYPERVKCGIPLRELTSIVVGGPAAAVCTLRNVDDAKRFQAFAVEHGLRWYVLGAGSNILAADAGFQGLVLKVELADYSVSGESVTVGAGFDFDALISRTLKDGLVGLEFASGIPGTVGGAVVGNAGCFGHEIGEYVVSATVLAADGGVVALEPDGLSFRYRDSALKESGATLLAVKLRLRRGDVNGAQQIRAEKLALRRRKHPVDLPCAGSYFKNLPPAAPGQPRRAAGELLDRIGAKDLRVGDAAVFERHANIIVNRGRATSADVRELAARMRSAVLDRFGIELEEEVRYLTTERGHGSVVSSPVDGG